jgi:hypothetical protein
MHLAPPRLRAVFSVAAGVTFLLLCGCLKHKETFSVSADGHVHLAILATGDARDLADGSLVPTSPGWIPEGRDVVAWRAQPKAAGSSPAVDESLWRRPDGKARDDVQIGASRAFARVEDLPTSSANPGDPYPEGALRFTTRLQVRKEGGRVVYVFERTYHAVPGAVRRTWNRLTERVQKHLGRIWDGAPLTDDEKREIATALREAMLDVGDRLARDAVAAHYVEGAATLPLATRERALTEVHDAVAKLVSLKKLVGVLDAERAQAKKNDASVSPLLRLDQEFRDTIRATLRASALGAGLGEAEVNGVLHAYEVSLVRNDAAQDFDDDDFEVEVKLPGTIVGGNFASAEGATARFVLRGADLQDKDVLLRAESVLEDRR